MLVETDIIKLVCARLEQARIPYMITGSFAANFYAVPRMTRDIDLVLALLDVDVARFTALFRHDFVINENSIKEAIKYESMFNIIHNTAVLKIDCILRKNTEYRHVEFQQRRRMPFEDTQIWIVSPEDLVISKLFWAKDSLSEMQLRDIVNLASHVRDLNLSYIRDWVKKLELEAIYRRANIDE